MWLTATVNIHTFKTLIDKLNFLCEPEKKETMKKTFPRNLPLAIVQKKNFHQLEYYV